MPEQSRSHATNDKDNSRSPKPSRTTIKSKKAYKIKRPKIPPLHAQQIDKAVSLLAREVTPFIRGVFKEHTYFHNNGTLMYPGAEMQVVYNCFKPHLSKRSLQETAEWIESVLKSELDVKLYQTVIVAYALPRYVQVIITFYDLESYDEIAAKLKKAEGSHGSRRLAQ